MASQKRLPEARIQVPGHSSTMDHARHGFLPRHRDTGILDPLELWRGDRFQGSGHCSSVFQDSHHAARTAHYGSLPQKSHGRTQDENPVVHFFKNIVTPRTPPPSQGKGAEGQKPGFGYGGRASDYKSAHKGFKGVDAQGTLSRIFKLASGGPPRGAERRVFLGV
uniref:Myelin basic protein n=1 Tax=Macaca fascicularis TaxID=9541 RepID=A0A2K5VYC1_MACFA